MALTNWPQTAPYWACDRRADTPLKLIKEHIMAETIQLLHPFEVNGETITEVTLRRPKIRDMERAQKHKDDMAKSIHMLVDLTELPIGTIRELDTEDFNQLAKRVGEYTGDAAD
jgi:hypothetical protein